MMKRHALALLGAMAAINGGIEPIGISARPNVAPELSTIDSIRAESGKKRFRNINKYRISNSQRKRRKLLRSNPHLRNSKKFK